MFFPPLLSRTGALLFLCSLCLPCWALAATDEGRRVAVVIGIGSYRALPVELANPKGREDARTLAALLETWADFQEVHLLIDDQATRASIESLLFVSLPSRLNSKDSLLVYFTGFGVGGDFGEPYLLPWDADPAKVQESAIPARDFGNRLGRSLPVGALSLITDASHAGRLGDLALIGPTARVWPEPTGVFFALSATSAAEVPSTDSFGAHVIEGLKGRADVSGDLQVSAGELTRYVVDKVVKDSQDRSHPSEGGSYDGGLVLASVDPQALAPPVPPERARRSRRISGAASLGGAALLAGGSTWFYLQGRELEPQYFGREPIPAGSSFDDVRGAYSMNYWLHTSFFVGAGLLAATGGTLILWPSASGAQAALQLRW